MLWTIAVVLVILWLLGLVSGYTVENYIHIAFVFAIIAMLVHVEEECHEEECHNLGPGRTRMKHPKQRAFSGSRRILPKLATLSGEKVSQPLTPPKTY